VKRASTCRAGAAATVASLLEAVRRRETEVPLDVIDRVADRRRPVVARQQQRRAEVDRASPELGQRRTLELDALHVLVVGGHLNRRDDLVGDELDHRLLFRIEVHFRRCAVDVAGRARPVLTFPLIVVHPEHVAIGALELRVDVHDGLHPVVAGGNVGHVEDRRAELHSIDHRRRTRREMLDVVSEHRRTDAPDLKSRLGRLSAADDRVDASSQRLVADRRGDANLERDLRASGRSGKNHRGLRARETWRDERGDGEESDQHTRHAVSFGESHGAFSVGQNGSRRNIFSISRR
jgi:hypothetical protein